MTGAVGFPTRGTTSRRRLRRVDSWLLATHPGLLTTPGALVVDLGFGASPVTTVELARRVRALNAHAQVVGVEIDPDRVRVAVEAGHPDARFACGGFELAGLRPHLVRAFNVLRQYAEAEVPAAWAQMCGRLASGGRVVEGTCDELGRLGAWVTLGARGPQSLTLLVDLRRPPGDVAARLPKALIHRNVDGEPIHALLRDLDRRWQRAATFSAFGARQRFVAAVRALAPSWPVLNGPSRWRRGELTVAWSAVGCGIPVSRPVAR